MAIDTTQRIRYIGTKTLTAWPATLGAYNEYRGWVPPPGDEVDKPGYLVEYEDGGTCNDARHDGYISWSPADVFERTYKPYTQMPVIDTNKLTEEAGRGYDAPGPIVLIDIDEKVDTMNETLEALYLADRLCRTLQGDEDATFRQVREAGEALKVAQQNADIAYEQLKVLRSI
jgi:hypothetical protein